MTTETIDATQQDAPDSTTVEPSAREIAMDAIISQRMDDFNAENQEAESLIESQIAAQTEAQPVDLDDQIVRVKIDGVESEVTVSEMRRQYQKNGAAERRLEEATRLLNEARQAQQTVPEPLRFAPEESKPDSGDDEQGKAFLAALFEGDEGKALEELKKIGIGRSQQAPTLDINQVAAQIAPAIKQQMFVENALEKFAVEFADIVADPYLADLADRYLDAEVEAGRPYDQALEQAGLKTRDWLSSKGITQRAPNPTIDRNTKLERKAGMDRIPALNSKATTVEVPEQSATDVINEMRRARGFDV